MSGHTPGPWTLHESQMSRPAGHLFFVKGNGFTVAESYKPANARLIAKAPEMCEALQFVLDAINRLRDMRSVELNNQDQLAEELNDMENVAGVLLAELEQ